VFVSSNARKTLPAEVLSHPAVSALVERGTPTGSLTPEEVRQASEDAQVEPRHLKALLAHLSALGISVSINATSSRAAAAESPRRTTSAKTTAKKTYAASTASATASAAAPSTTAPS
jgi:RNA polymerase primary sigma factor